MAIKIYKGRGRAHTRIFIEGADRCGIAREALSKEPYKPSNSAHVEFTVRFFIEPVIDALVETNPMELEEHTIYGRTESVRMQYLNKFAVRHTFHLDLELRGCKAETREKRIQDAKSEIVRLAATALPKKVAEQVRWNITRINSDYTDDMVQQYTSTECWQLDKIESIQPHQEELAEIRETLDKVKNLLSKAYARRAAKLCEVFAAGIKDDEMPASVKQTLQDRYAEGKAFGQDRVGRLAGW